MSKGPDEAPGVRPDVGMEEWARERLSKLLSPRHGLLAFIRAARKPGVMYVRECGQGGAVICWRPDHPLEQSALMICTAVNYESEAVVFVHRTGSKVATSGGWSFCGERTWRVDGGSLATLWIR